LRHGVISQDGMGGKRAMRIYPAWDVVNSKQAKKTQEWQLKYFVELCNNDATVANIMKRLLYDD